MKKLYVKTEEGEFVPVTLERVFSDPSEWDNAFILVRVGGSPSSEDLYEVWNALATADALAKIKNASFLVVGPEFEFKPLKEI
jgi:predicted glycosyltransferase